MATSIKAVSDAIIDRLVSEVDQLNNQTVTTFSGSLREFAGQKRNLPFAGVSLRGACYKELNTDNTLTEEHLTFKLVLIAEDFRGRRFTVDNAYELIDSVRDALMGFDLGLSGLAPLNVAACEKDEEAEKDFLAVYRMTISTWQVRQNV